MSVVNNNELKMNPRCFWWRFPEQPHCNNSTVDLFLNTEQVGFQWPFTGCIL